MRRCVFTVLYGGHDRLPEQSVRSRSGLDFIAFVGEPVEPAGWTLRHLPAALPGDPVRSARLVKLLPHRHLADYDESLYLDCTVRLERPPEALFAAWLDGAASGFACLRHAARGCLADEAKAVLAGGLDDPARLAAQLAAYAGTDFCDAVPVIWSGLLLRRHNAPAVAALGEAWAQHVLCFSRRDQIAFPFVAERLGFAPTVHDVPIQRSAFHRWPVPEEHGRAPWQVRPPRPDGCPSITQARLREALAIALDQCGSPAIRDTARTPAGRGRRLTEAWRWVRGGPA